MLYLLGKYGLIDKCAQRVLKRYISTETCADMGLLHGEDATFIILYRALTLFRSHEYQD